MTSPAKDDGAAANVGEAAAQLLSWYDRSARTLPWRMRAGERADPYAVWLSEVMLQQTTVAAVIPYYETFLARWPTVHALAAAPLDDVLRAWAGLGYYARARNLHACARTVATELSGRFPETAAELKRLPGIGDYTAAAIAAIVFGQSAVVVDGNVERVIARRFAVETPLPGAKAQLRELAGRLTPAARPGDYAQAVMDLGATVCTVRQPRCGGCPWAAGCAGRAAGIAETLPRRAPKAQRPTRHGAAFWISDGDGAVLLRRRPERGLLGGMMEVPSTAWGEAPIALSEAHAAAPFRAPVEALPGLVKHTFTHFHLELAVLAGRVEGKNPKIADGGGVWVAVDRLGERALPSLMRKVAAHALGHLAG
ncbi:MAG TPA: A/G-specific adenine glycosylase [Alphaproteobacteria bacterium]|nr:A/G-specific adenine glycosylase [Alphaproteobacteria bacterium]